MLDNRPLIGFNMLEQCQSNQSDTHNSWSKTLSQLNPARNVINYEAYVAHFHQLKSLKDYNLLKVQAYQQKENFTCGPASVMSLLHYYGLLSSKDMNKETELRIAYEMGTTATIGTTPQQIAQWLENQGLEVTLGESGTLGLLKENIQKGIPTLVEWIDWGGHWVLATGYAGADARHPSQDTIFLADSNAQQNNQKNINGITSFNAERFDAMWFDAQYFKPGKIIKGIYITATMKK